MIGRKIKGQNRIMTPFTMAGMLRSGAPSLPNKKGAAPKSVAGEKEKLRQTR